LEAIMNARSTTRLTASLVLATGLLAAPAVPVTAIDASPAAVIAAPAKHKLPDRCWPSYKHDLQRLQRRMDYQIEHYQSHYTSVNSLLDNMIDVLTSGSQDVLPQMEAGVEQYRTRLAPIITKDRNEVNKLLDSVQKQNKNCFKGKRQDTFLAGMKSARSAFRDLFRAYEMVQGAAGYLTTAQTAKAQEKLNEAQLEAATVEDILAQGVKQMRGLW
jgi:hypothetical protein